jgi:hypothetical protein
MSVQEKLVKSKAKIWKKWSIAFKIVPILLIVTLLKFIAHRYELDVIELNGLFTSLVAGTIFLIGFLISGVLSDYKESEKIPSELAASIRNLLDDTYTIYKIKNSQTARQFIEYQKSFLEPLMDWIYKKEKIKFILGKISKMNDFFIELDKEGVQANYIIKMKNEQNNIRKMVMRIDTIRDTEFVGSAYAIVEVMGLLIVLGLVTIKISPFYVSILFTLLVTFLISYMFMLIVDLDNPFDYKNKGETGTEISLKPLNDLSLFFEEYNQNL